LTIKGTKKKCRNFDKMFIKMKIDVINKSYLIIIFSMFLNVLNIDRKVLNYEFSNIFIKSKYIKFKIIPTNKNVKNICLRISRGYN